MVTKIIHAVDRRLIDGDREFHFRVDDILYVTLQWDHMRGNYTHVQNKYETLWFWIRLLRQPAV